MRPRVALIAASTDILGGQAVQAETLAAALRREGWPIELVATNPRFPRGLGWLRRLRYARTVLNEALYAASLAAVRRADVVHVFTASYWSFLLVAAPAIAAARLAGKRVVLNYHSGEADDHLRRWGALVHPWLRLADTIVVPSDYLRQVFARHGHRAVVVRNVIEPGRFRYRERLALRPLLLSNRNLEAHYRIDDAIRAHALLRRQHRDARLIVAGSGREAGRLHRLGEDLGDGTVQFVGRVEPVEMPRIYDACDVLVNASVIDNQPLTLLEAFAAGLPVVTTPTGDIAAMVRHGETGLLVPPRDPTALAHAVAWLLAHPREGAAMAARARAELDRYQWNEVGESWERIYRGEAA